MKVAAVLFKTPARNGLARRSDDDDVQQRPTTMPPAGTLRRCAARPTWARGELACSTDL